MAKKSPEAEYKRELRNLVVPDGVESIDELILTPQQSQFLLSYINNGFKLKKSLDDAKILASSYYNWINKYPHFAKAIDLCREKFVDEIEDAFKDLIDDRNPQAVMFGLKTLGRNRGYSEKTEIDLNTNIIEKITVNIPDEVKELLKNE